MGKSYNSDGPLVSGHNSTTNLLGGNFGHVHNNDGGDETDTETRNHTATYQKADSGGSHLEGNTAREDNASTHDSPTPTNPVRKGTADESTNEGTCREDGSDQALLPCVDVVSRGI